MADNISVIQSDGTSATIRTDDVSSVHYSVVKIALGLDGAFDILLDSGQQTMANSLPVVLSSDHTDVKITLDSEAVVLGAGSAAIGKLAANSGVDIGDVDVTTLPAITIAAAQTLATVTTVGAVTAISNALPAGNNNIGDVDVASIAAGDNLVGRVKISDGTDVALVTAGGLLQVDASGAAVPVTDNSSSLTVDQSTASSLKCAPAGLIADDGAESGGENPLKIATVVKAFDGTDPGNVSAEDDRAHLISDMNRRVYVNDVHPFNWKAQDNQSSAQTNTSLKSAPGAGYSFYITDIIFSNGATAGNIRLVEDPSGTPANLTPPMYFAVNGGASIHLRTPIKVTSNKGIGYTSVTVTTHSVEITGFTAKD